MDRAQLKRKHKNEMTGKMGLMFGVYLDSEFDEGQKKVTLHSWDNPVRSSNDLHVTIGGQYK